MWMILVLFFCGMIVGYCLKNREKILFFTGRITTGTIWLLLFLMGVSVGANKKVMYNLHSIGLKALLIAVFSIIGSIAVVWFVERKIMGRKML